ncbi:Hypothetical protein CINCED_3A006643 [Cinara cedri]|uniref:Uncharacterized protein n=1 Tax=Cinara cedri TaxID=506608 RepID=A0A5E4MV24_9HEMI|nr:Hypothetical protein CINCED_3A006643 [Cinara cedri]
MYAYLFIGYEINNDNIINTNRRQLKTTASVSLTENLRPTLKLQDINIDYEKNNSSSSSSDLVEHNVLALEDSNDTKCSSVDNQSSYDEHNFINTDETGQLKNTDLVKITANMRSESKLIGRPDASDVEVNSSDEESPGLKEPKLLVSEDEEEEEDSNGTNCNLVVNQSRYEVNFELISNDSNHSESTDLVIPTAGPKFGSNLERETDPFNDINNSDEDNTFESEQQVTMESEDNNTDCSSDVHHSFHEVNYETISNKSSQSETIDSKSKLEGEKDVLDDINRLNDGNSISEPEELFVSESEDYYDTNCSSVVTHTRYEVNYELISNESSQLDTTDLNIKTANLKPESMLEVGNHQNEEDNILVPGELTELVSEDSIDKNQVNQSCYAVNYELISNDSCHSENSDIVITNIDSKSESKLEVEAIPIYGINHHHEENTISESGEQLVLEPEKNYKANYSSVINHTRYSSTIDECNQLKTTGVKGSDSKPELNLNDKIHHLEDINHFDEDITILEAEEPLSLESREVMDGIHVVGGDDYEVPKSSSTQRNHSPESNHLTVTTAKESPEPNVDNENVFSDKSKEHIQFNKKQDLINSPSSKSCNKPEVSHINEEIINSKSEEHIQFNEKQDLINLPSSKSCNKPEVSQINEEITNSKSEEHILFNKNEDLINSPHPENCNKPEVSHINEEIINSKSEEHILFNKKEDLINSPLPENCNKPKVIHINEEIGNSKSEEYIQFRKQQELINTLRYKNSYKPKVSHINEEFGNSKSEEYIQFRKQQELINTLRYKNYNKPKVSHINEEISTSKSEEYIEFKNQQDLINTLRYKNFNKPKVSHINEVFSNSKSEEYIEFKNQQDLINTLRYKNFNKPRLIHINEDFSNSKSEEYIQFRKQQELINTLRYKNSNKPKMNYLDEDIIISKPKEQLQLVDEQNVIISKDGLNSYNSNREEHSSSNILHVIYPPDASFSSNNFKRDGHNLNSHFNEEIFTTKFNEFINLSDQQGVNSLVNLDHNKTSCETIQQKATLEMANVITTLMSYTKNSNEDETVDSNNLHDFDHFVEIVTNTKLEEKLRLEQKKFINSKGVSNGNNSRYYEAGSKLNDSVEIENNIDPQVSDKSDCEIIFMSNSKENDTSKNENLLRIPNSVSEIENNIEDNEKNTVSGPVEKTKRRTKLNVSIKLENILGVKPYFISGDSLIKRQNLEKNQYLKLKSCFSTIESLNAKKTNNNSAATTKDKPLNYNYTSSESDYSELEYSSTPKYLTVMESKLNTFKNEVNKSRISLFKLFHFHIYLCIN